MIGKIIILIIVIVFMVLAYASFLAAHVADEEADRMYRDWQERKRKGETEHTDCPWK